LSRIVRIFSSEFKTINPFKSCFRVLSIKNMSHPENWDDSHLQAVARPGLKRSFALIVICFTEA
jgi:hypothetical protein